MPSFCPTPRRLLSLIIPLFLLVACVSSQSAVKQPAESMVVEPADPACSYFYYSWGRSAELEGRLLEAQDAYNKALVCDENSEFLKRQMVHLLISMDKKERAALILESIVEQEGASPKTRLEMAGMFENLGKTDNAIALLKEILEDDPDDSQALLTLGYLYFRHEQLVEARMVLEEYVELEPDSYSGAVMMAKLYRSLGDEKRAAAMYEKVLELNWSLVQAVDAAEFYESMGDEHRAMEIYEKILEGGDSSPTLRRKLVTLYLENDQNDKAMGHLLILRGETNHPERVDLVIGRVLIDQKKTQQAIDHFAKMLTSYPDVDVIRPLLALAYHEAGDSDSARKVLAQVEPDSPEFRDAVLMSVRLYQESDELDKGAELLEEVLKDEEKRLEVFYFILADIYLTLKEPGKGEKVFARAVEQFPEKPRVRFEYGLYLEKNGQPERALELMEQVLELDKDDPLALNFIGYTWADKGIRLDEALDYIQRAVKARPQDGFIRDSLGWVYYKMGNYDKAVEELSKAASQQPKDPTINEHLGDALHKEGKIDKAIAAYERSIKLHKNAKKRAKVRKKLVELKKDASR